MTVFVGVVLLLPHDVLVVAVSCHAGVLCVPPPLSLCCWLLYDTDMLWDLLGMNAMAGSLGEHKIRDLNDEINKLLRTKAHWERRILELGGPNYEVTALLP